MSEQVSEGSGSAALSEKPVFERSILLEDLLPILTIHAICLGAIWTGGSWIAAGVAALLFLARMFVITGFYHRYFSHRTFKTHRVVQALASAFGTTCAQRGPVWWAAHHRSHHRHSDTEPDMHSPTVWGLLFSHMGWFMTEKGLKTDWAAVPDWQKFPELRAIEKYHMVGPFALAVGMWGLGWALERWAPGLGTGPWQMLVWGFGISTTLLYHATFTINSLAHTIGSRRFKTKDDSRNSWFLALITLGEGWHNNHHYFPGSVRQGFYWWEFDPTYYGLVAMKWMGLVWDLAPVPARVYEAAAQHRTLADPRAADVEKAA